MELLESYLSARMCSSSKKLREYQMPETSGYPVIDKLTISSGFGKGRAE